MYRSIWRSFSWILTFSFSFLWLYPLVSLSHKNTQKLQKIDWSDHTYSLITVLYRIENFLKCHLRCSSRARRDRTNLAAFGIVFCTNVLLVDLGGVLSLQYTSLASDFVDLWCILSLKSAVKKLCWSYFVFLHG